MGNVLLALADTGEHAVEFSTTLVFTGILVAMVLALAFEEKIHAKKSVITGITALLCFVLGELFGVLPHHPLSFISEGLAWGDPLHLPIYIPGVDWEVIAIILGSSLFVDVTSKSGLFSWIAIRLTKASKGACRDNGRIRKGM